MIVTPAYNFKPMVALHARLDVGFRATDSTDQRNTF